MDPFEQRKSYREILRMLDLAEDTQDRVNGLKVQRANEFRRSLTLAFLAIALLAIIFFESLAYIDVISISRDELIIAMLICLGVIMSFLFTTMWSSLRLLQARIKKEESNLLKLIQYCSYYQQELVQHDLDPLQRATIEIRMTRLQLDVESESL